MPLAIKDLSGRLLMMSDQAWITKKPNVNRGKSASEGKCQWVLLAAVPDSAFLAGGQGLAATRKHPPGADGCSPLEIHGGENYLM